MDWVEFIKELWERDEAEREKRTLAFRRYLMDKIKTEQSYGADNVKYWPCEHIKKEQCGWVLSLKYKDAESHFHFPVDQFDINTCPVKDCEAKRPKNIQIDWLLDLIERNNRSDGKISFSENIKRSILEFIQAHGPHTQPFSDSEPSDITDAIKKTDLQWLNFLGIKK